MKWDRAILGAGVLAAAGIAAVAGAVGRDQTEAQPLWHVGTCYRAYVDDDKPPHLIKIVEMDAAWIRVEPQPAGPKIPGARERDPLWINTAELFAVQQADCPTVVGR